MMETGDKCERCGGEFEFGDRVYEAMVDGKIVFLCGSCYTSVARRWGA